VYPIETVALRFFNVFGLRQDPYSQYAAVIPRFITEIAAGRTVPIHGDGSQSRDFTYVANVVEATLLAADAVRASGAILNVATGRSVTVNALADAIATVVGRPVVKEYLAPRAGDVSHSWADIRAAQQILGWQPRVSLEEGLRLTAERLTG